jgi:hypothetical protein
MKSENKNSDAGRNCTGSIQSGRNFLSWIGLVVLLAATTIRTGSPVNSGPNSSC